MKDQDTDSKQLTWDERLSTIASGLTLVVGLVCILSVAFLPIIKSDQSELLALPNSLTILLIVITCILWIVVKVLSLSLMKKNDIKGEGHYPFRGLLITVLLCSFLATIISYTVQIVF